MTVPVVFFIYNRPEITRRAFASIRDDRPRKLIIVADGPRDDDDQARCQAARSVAELVDWPCDLETDFASRNLGCSVRVATGISSVLQRFDSAIFIEDDCIADRSFYRFTREMLDRYADDERIAAIIGANFQFGFARPRESYWFSRFPIPWGWATWARAWRQYDREMKAWPAMRESSWIVDVFDGDASAARHWTAAFDRAYRKEIDTWDYAWMFACWRNQALTVVPERNLVTNIGFSRAATHTAKFASALANIPSSPLAFPLRHPTEIRRNEAADRHIQKRVFEHQRLLWLNRIAKSFSGKDFRDARDRD